MDAAIAQKFQRTFGVADGPIRNRGVIDDNETEGDTSHHEQFKTGTVLMYGGQGKKIDTNNLKTISQRGHTMSTRSTLALFRQQMGA